MSILIFVLCLILLTVYIVQYINFHKILGIYRLLTVY